MSHATPREVEVRRTLRMLTLLTVAVALAAGCAGGGDGEASSAASTAATAAPATTAGGGSEGGGRGGYGREPGGDDGGGTGGQADKDDVRIEAFAFDPRTIRAEAGQRVKWENDDVGVTHTVTADRGAFDSGDLTRGKEFSFVFRTAGTFAYHCTIHPKMRGTVEVR
jgi:plastocyanin